MLCCTNFTLPSAVAWLWFQPAAVTPIFLGVMTPQTQCTISCTVVTSCFLQRVCQDNDERCSIQNKSTKKRTGENPVRFLSPPPFLTFSAFSRNVRIFSFLSNYSAHIIIPNGPGGGVKKMACGVQPVEFKLLIKVLVLGWAAPFGPSPPRRGIGYSMNLVGPAKGATFANLLKFF